MLTLLLAYLILAVFFITEGRLRSGSAARSLEAGEFDQNSTRRVGQGVVFAALVLLAAPLLNLMGVGRLPWPVLGWAGVLIALLGLGLRAWANRVLGQFYSRTLRVTSDQAIIQNGPYRLVRHPGYLGTILLWSGAALAALNGIALFLVLIVLFAVYTYRIRFEERMLLAAFGEPYQQYRAHTWRLIPFIF